MIGLSGLAVVEPLMSISLAAAFRARGLVGEAGQVVLLPARHHLPVDSPLACRCSEVARSRNGRWTCLRGSIVSPRTRTSFQWDALLVLATNRIPLLQWVLRCGGDVYQEDRSQVCPPRGGACRGVPASMDQSHWLERRR